MSERGYIVQYKVVGQCDKVFTAGPYNLERVAWEHFRDIAGYEGVHDVRVRPHPASGKDEGAG